MPLSSTREPDHSVNFNKVLLTMTLIASVRFLPSSEEVSDVVDLHEIFAGKNELDSNDEPIS